MVAARLAFLGKEECPRIRFVDHPSFHEKDAASLYRDGAEVLAGAVPTASHLPDDATRDLAKRMHYAAFRTNNARNAAGSRVWHSRYLDLRDRIILGNRKLIYRAVRTRVQDPQLAEDCASECHLVMIRAVTSYNPWLGIRFSTYAFTCLLRELTRLVQRRIKDRLRQALSVDDFPFHEALGTEADDPCADRPDVNLDQFFSSGHPLLNDREKHVLSQRFGLNSRAAKATLKDIGSELRISKERVRQLQNSGLVKLREVLATDDVDA